MFQMIYFKFHSIGSFARLIICEKLAFSAIYIRRKKLSVLSVQDIKLKLTKSKT